MGRIDVHERAKREQQRGRRLVRAGEEHDSAEEIAEGRALQNVGKRRHIQVNVKHGGRRADRIGAKR